MSEDRISGVLLTIVAVFIPIVVLVLLGRFVAAFALRIAFAFGAAAAVGILVISFFGLFAAFLIFAPSKYVGPVVDRLPIGVNSEVSSTTHASAASYDRYGDEMFPRTEEGEPLVELDNGRVVKSCGCTTKGGRGERGFVPSWLVDDAELVWVRFDHGSGWIMNPFIERRRRCTECGRLTLAYTPVIRNESAEEIRVETSDGEFVFVPAGWEYDSKWVGPSADNQDYPSGWNDIPSEAIDGEVRNRYEVEEIPSRSVSRQNHDLRYDVVGVPINERTPLVKRGDGSPVLVRRLTTPAVDEIDRELAESAVENAEAEDEAEEASA